MFNYNADTNSSIIREFDDEIIFNKGSKRWLFTLYSYLQMIIIRDSSLIHSLCHQNVLLLIISRTIRQQRPNFLQQNLMMLAVRRQCIQFWKKSTRISITFYEQKKLELSGIFSTGTSESTLFLHIFERKFRFYSANRAIPNKTCAASLAVNSYHFI